MRQPVMIVLDVPDDTEKRVLADDLERTLRARGYKIEWAIPMSYTLEVPEGAISA